MATSLFAFGSEFVSSMPDEDTLSSPSNSPRACFSATQNTYIASTLSPKAEYNETSQTIEAIHKLIWRHRHQIDPRLVYYRLFGESQADPFQINPNSGAYGLFQFLGKPYGSSRTHRQIIESLMVANPDKSPRLVQVEYYMNVYLQNFITAADQGYGCNKNKKFSAYTDMEKVTYLGWGACGTSAQTKELALCQENQSYRLGPCSFASEIVQGNSSLPLCDNP